MQCFVWSHYVLDGRGFILIVMYSVCMYTSPEDVWLLSGTCIMVSACRPWLREDRNLPLGGEESGVGVWCEHSWWWLHQTVGLSVIKSQTMTALRELPRAPRATPTRPLMSFAMLCELEFKGLAWPQDCNQLNNEYYLVYPDFPFCGEAAKCVSDPPFT